MIYPADMIITQTPLRLSFLGGNTDFRDFYLKHGGAVLSTAIDKYIYCVITERFDEKIYLAWSKREIVNDVSEIEHELVREAMKKVGVKKGIEIHFVADIPSEGSGLGSSSSVTVGVLNALYHYVGHSPSEEQLAREAVEIEIDILGKPIGVQDQYIAAYGGFRLFEFHKDGTITSQKVPLSNGNLNDFSNHLMLFYTGKTRQAGNILQNVKNGLSDKEKILLRNKELAYEGEKIIRDGDALGFGKMLNEYWELKKGLSDGISNDEIDEMYRATLSAGAVGGKIAGAGGGGFLLLVVPGDKRPAVRKALADFQEMPFGLERDGSKVIFNVRRY